jgi:VanZ family protein
VLNTNHIRFLRIYGPAVVWGIFILIATLTPGRSLPSSSLFRFDKLIHVIIFGVFAWLVLRALYLSGHLTPENSFRIYILVASVTIVFGIAIELLQQLIPDRGADINDVIANTTGIILAQLIFYFTHRKKQV